MKITEIFLIILPVAIVWLLTPLFLLIYAFDMLSATFQIDITQNILNPGVLILVLTTFLASLSLYITGYFVDRNPQLVKPLITGSLVATGISLFLVIVGVNFVIFVLIGFPSLGISLGILATVAGAFYAGYTDVYQRGRVYACAIFLSAMVSLVILAFSSALNWDYEIPLLFIGCITILTALIFYFISLPISPWVNDKFPTPISQILSRRSVKNYLVSRFFIYLMLGVAFATISQIGQVRYPDLSLNLPFFGITTFSHTIIFWIVVFFADLVCVIPMGWFSDRFSRKNLIVMGVYGIVISALIVGLSENPLMYYFSAYLLGVSFAAFHPSLDSAVWADISPLD
ncbi:MAG: MFS transporter, partial [Promethearchaeota archaeon]